MRSTAADQENHPAILSQMPWHVAKVQALPGFRLHVRFIDETEGAVDLSRLLASAQAGVFAQLADPDRFGQVGVSYGAVTWPGEPDLAPDAMYARLRSGGEWVL